MQAEKIEALKESTEGWLKAKKVELGIGEWSSPCFPVATKTRGKWRGVVDMRHVNEQCVEDSYPLLRIEDLLVQQGRFEIHSALDVKDAFHQIPMEESSRCISCTVTPLGMFQWRVVVTG